MRIKFWGTRGSIPTSFTSEVVRLKIIEALTGAAGLDLADSEVLEHYMDRLPSILQKPVGGNTPCIEVQTGDQLLILDAGSGLRELSLDLVNRGFNPEKAHFDFLITHTHWDHIQGFPFFQFVFYPHNRLTFYSAVADLEERFTRLISLDHSLREASNTLARLKFVYLKPEQAFKLKNLTITPIELSHPGKSYGYRIEDEVRCLVYASDAAYEQVDQKYVDFFRGADLLIFDSHFSFKESIDKVDWGHGTAMFGAEFAYRAQVKRLALFHHDPACRDETIYLAMQQAQAYLTHRTFLHEPCQVLIAKDGLELEI
jgi:phosphoribosyl 1,2-cyclic phosphodiesterase